jgi:phosphoglycolate phosphatase-like HAD superfamily hydrolase
MHLKMIRLAVFDWNCTLIDDVEACLTAKNAALEFLGHDPITLERLRDIFTFPIIHAYERAGVHPDRYLEHAHDISEIFVGTYEREAEHCGLREGVHQLLDWLHARDIPAIILSNHLQQPLQERVVHMGLDHHFEAILGTQHYATIARKMDKQERLEAYMAEHGYDARHSLIIGDTHEEAELARNLGMTGISITGGLFSRQRLEACQPDYIIDHPRQMIDICETQWPQIAYDVDERGTTGTAG